jgi:hypothetical protein
MRVQGSDCRQTTLLGRHRVDRQPRKASNLKQGLARCPASQKQAGCSYRGARAKEPVEHGACYGPKLCERSRRSVQDQARSEPAWNCQLPL